MTKLYVGIDVAKDKFDVSYTTDGQNIFGYSTFVNDKKGIKKFLSSGGDLKNAAITLQCVDRNDFQFIDVYVNGFYIGDIPGWNEVIFIHVNNLLKNNKVEKVHVRMETETIIYDKGTLERPRFYLFLKED